MKIKHIDSAIRKLIIVFLSFVTIGTIFIPICYAEPRFSVGFDVSYGERKGWDSGFEAAYFMNKYSIIKLKKITGQEESYWALDYIYKFYSFLYLGCGLSFLHEERDIYLTTPDKKLDLGMYLVAGAEMPMSIVNGFIEYSQLTTTGLNRMSIGIKYLFE